MEDDDPQQPQQRYWFPYWTSPPPPRPPVRSELSRRESRPSPPSPPLAPSPSRRPSLHQPTMAAPRGAASPQAQPQLSSKPSPSRAAPLAPTSHNQPQHPSPPPPPPLSKSNAGAALPPATTHEAPKQKDVAVVSVDKTVQATAADHKPHGKARDKEHKTPKDKEKKDTKIKEPVSKPKEKEEEVPGELAKKKSHGGVQGKLHNEIKEGVDDMVQKVGASSGHERAAGTSVITLAGESKGASMKIGANSKERSGHRLDGGDKEEGGKGMTALINSNVQVINNSLMLHSSCSGGDPGVHLKLCAKSRSEDKQQQGGSDGGGKATAGPTTTSKSAKK